MNARARTQVFDPITGHPIVHVKNKPIDISTGDIIPTAG